MGHGSPLTSDRTDSGCVLNDGGGTERLVRNNFSCAHNAQWKRQSTGLSTIE